MPAPAREAGAMKELEERGDPGRDDRVEHDVGSALGDPLDGRAIVHVVERVVLLADDRAAVCSHGLADTLVQDVRPDVVGAGKVERLRAGLAHQPRDERIDLLRRHRAGAEDQRVGLLPLVLLGVDVEGLAFDDRRALDRLARRAVDAAEDDIDPVLLDELPRRCRGQLVVRPAVLDDQLDVPAEQPALGVDVADDHPGDVGVRGSDEREGAGLVRDDSDLDGVTDGVCCRHACLLRE